MIRQWLLGGKGLWFTTLGTSLSLEKYCFACWFLQFWACFFRLTWASSCVTEAKKMDVTMKYEDCINSWCRRASEYLEDTFRPTATQIFEHSARFQKMVLCKIKIGVVSSFYNSRVFNHHFPYELVTQPWHHPSSFPPRHSMDISTQDIWTLFMCLGWFEVAAEPTFSFGDLKEVSCMLKEKKHQNKIKESYICVYIWYIFFVMIYMCIYLCIGTFLT